MFDTFSVCTHRHVIEFQISEKCFPRQAIQMRLIRGGIQSISRCAIYQRCTFGLTFMIDRAIISRSCRKCKCDVSTGSFYRVVMLYLATISKFKLLLSFINNQYIILTRYYNNSTLKAASVFESSLLRDFVRFT